MVVNIIIGSIVLSIIHAIIPNHWAPILVMGKGQKWNKSKMRRVAFLAGIAHTSSSILIGILVGILGIRLTDVSLHAMEIAAPALFFAFGLYYLIVGIRDTRRNHEHQHLHLDKVSGKSEKAAVFSLALAMFFSPCIEIESYFFNASVVGWIGIFSVAVTYFVITVAGIMLMVELGRKGLETMKFHFLEHYEKQIMGIILIIMAVVTYVYFNH